MLWHINSVFFFFFFSSRRRHTRCSRDWSSDVCSSDLGGEGPGPPRGRARPHDARARLRRRAVARQGVPCRELSAAPRHVREGRRLRLGGRGAGARAGLRRALQGGRLARDGPGRPARRPAVLRPGVVQPGRGRPDPVSRAGLAVTALLGALLLGSSARAASFALTPGEREDALRIGARSLTVETFDAEWRVANAAGESITVLTPFHRLAPGARAAAFPHEPPKPHAPGQPLRGQQGRLLLWAGLPGPREDFARFYAPRLLVS